MAPQILLVCTRCATIPCSCVRREPTPLQKYRQERKLALEKLLAGTVLWPSARRTAATPEETVAETTRLQGSYLRLYEDLREHNVNTWFANALVSVARQAEIDVSGITVTSGARTVAEQERLIALGQTTTSPAMSRHVPCGMQGEAVDLAGPPDIIAKLGRATYGTGIRWGGHWEDPEPWHFNVELTERPCRR